MKLVVKSLSILVVFSMFICSCMQPVKENRIENPDANHRILITGTTTEFKKEIIEGIVNRYRDICQLEILPYDKLESVDFGGYSAIVIVDECQAWMMFNRNAKKVVNKIENKDKIVLFITAGNPDWEYSTDGVDAITSASKKEREDELIKEISDRIDEMIRE